MYRSRIALLLALAATSLPLPGLAQEPEAKTEWSPFASAPPAAPAVRETTAVSDMAPAPAAPPASAPQSAPAASTEVKESVLPGSEPHSPGTWDKPLLARENHRAMSGLNGATGLLRTSSADIGPRGVVRLSLVGEYYSSEDFPVLGARNTRTAGTLAVDYAFLDFLEAFLSYSVSANTNNKASPPLMQSQGDMVVGLKGGYEVVRGLSLGGDLRLGLFPGVGAQDLRGYAFGFSPRLLASYDVRSVAPSVPLLAHLNLGVALDTTGELVTAHEPSPAEELALGLHRHDRLLFALGLEAPLPYATPFVEWGFGYPLGAKDLIGPDLQPVSAGSAMPHQLTVGAKVTALRDVALLAAVDIGLARRVAKGIPATAPYNLVFGISYNFDPLARGEVRLVEKTTVVEKKVEVATAPPSYTGKVAGVVTDAKTGKPLPGVIVEMAGSGLPPVASDPQSGKFLSFDLPAGKAQLAFAREGYKPAVVEAQVEVGKVSALQVSLLPLAKDTKVKVALVSGKKKVAGKVSFTGPRPAELQVAAEGSEIGLPKGRYVATVDAEGFLSKIKELEVPEDGVAILEIDLSPIPKRRLVVIKDDRIQIKQQVHFATGKAKILGDSYQLLDQVVDAIVRSNIKKIRVEGHTDNRGSKAKNLKLSKERAEAVVEYLLKAGIDASRLVAEGHGDARPIAPNLTARGRGLNRRVEFFIVER
ncbi:MAG: OmpA family protein [Myxococcales bacterium]|jgi:OOP family OmpA-OmpF porin